MALGYGYKYGYSYGLADPVTLLLPREDMLEYPGSGVHPTGTLTGSVDLLDPDPAFAGTNLASLPIIGVSVAFPGERAFSLYDDFYERFYIRTEALDFGVVARRTLQPYKVWNARLDTGILNIITSANLETDGVNLLGVTVPKSFGPLAEVIHTGEALASGDTQIAGSYTYQFTPEQVITLEVKGLRGKLWPLPINWSSTFREQLEFKTEILTSRSGKEQRIALRTTPRRSIEFNSVAEGESRRELNRSLDMAHFVDFLVPDAPRYATLSADAASGGDTLTFATFPDWAEEGVILTLTYGRRVGLARVLGIDAGAGTITTTEALAADWPAGTLVCPAIVGALQDEVQSQRLTDDVVQVSLKLDERPGYQDYITPPTAPVIHNGREVLVAKPNWSTVPTVNYQWASEWVDYDRGLTARFVPTEFGGRLIRWTYSEADYDSVKAIVDTFMRARGRRGEFYVPTWENDLPPKFDLAVSTSTLRVEGVDAAEVYAGSTVFDRIMLELLDGTRVFKKISAAEVVTDGFGEDSLFTMDSSWAANYAVADIRRVSFLMCARFASDSLSIDWLTDNKANIQFNIQTLEDLAPES